MKKLIIILFLFAFSLNAQVQLSEDWSFKPDKGLHSIVGFVGSSGTFLLVNNKTQDIDLAFRAAWMGSAFVAIGKEMADGMQGKEISLSDMSYTIASGLITAHIFRLIAKRKKRKWNEKFNVEF